MRVTVLKPGVFTEYGIPAPVGSVITVGDDYGRSLISSLQATDTDKVLAPSSALSVTSDRVMVAGRCSIPISGTTNVGGTGTQVEQVYRYICTEDCSDIEVVFANLHTTAAGVFSAGLQDYSVRAGLKLSNVGVGVQGATATGQTDLAVKAGAAGSLFFPFTLKAGQEFFLVWLITYVAAPATFPIGLASAASGESNAQGTGLTDRTGNGFLSPLNPSTSAFAPPVMVRGRPLSASKKPRFVVCGDSIASAGGNDSAELISGMNMIGWFNRAVGADYAFANIGYAGLSLQTLDAESVALQALRRSGIFNSGITHAVLPLGTNDFVGSDTVEQSLTKLLNQIDVFASAGTKSILVTPPPRTNVGNTTEASAGIYAKRQLFIQGMYLIASARNLQVFDASSLWSNPSNTMLWRTDLGTPTTDGVHPSPTLHTLAKLTFQSLIPTFTR